MDASRGGLALAVAASAAAALFIHGCATTPDESATRETAEKMVRAAYPAVPPQFKDRIDQDRAQQICSKIGGTAKLTQEEAAEVVKLARASIKYPPSGQLIGDWKAGAKLAYSGVGGRVMGGKLEKAKMMGALCSNCHALDPKEVNVGNLGPSLTGFGAQRGDSEAVARYVYEKIYNAWASFPCSNMPRLGASGRLSPEQITHLVAYVVHPQSPVNRK